MKEKYTTTAVILHWASAALILYNIAVGLWMIQLSGMQQFEPFQLHKSIGLTIFMLTFFRLAWRLHHTVPAPLPDMLIWQRRAAIWTHRALYLLMLSLPLTGWIIVSASPLDIPTLLFKTIPWPHLPVHNLSAHVRKLLGDVATVAHMVLAFTLIGLIILHVTAAIWHQFFRRDDLLWRIFPDFRRHPPLNRGG